MTGRPATARTRIKICGITTPDAARAAAAAGADAIGLVFAAGSPREIDDHTARGIVEALPPFVTTVGVLRDEPRRVPPVAFDLLQLHGAETEKDVARAERPVIRGFAFDEAQALRWDQCANVRALLVDGPAAGSGRAFPHEALLALMPRLRLPVILAGGLTPENVAEAIRAVRPYAVDVSSGVESAPGEKDPELIRAFCAAVRAADATRS